VLLRQRKYDEALAAFKSAQQMDPALAQAYSGEADVLRATGKAAAAVPLYKKAVDLDKKFPPAQLALGQTLVDLKRHDEAVAALTPGLKWGGEWRPRFLVALGDAELARDSLRDAGIYYTRAREEAPNLPEPHAALGRFYVARGIPGLAVPEYQTAVSLDTSSVQNHHGLGQALFYDKQYSEALREFEWVYRRDPQYAPNLLSLGYLYYLSGPATPSRYADAKPPLERYVQMRPDDPRGWSVLGRTLYFLEEKDRAFEYVTKAVQMGEGGKETYTVLGRMYTERKEWDKALNAFAKGELDERDQLRVAQIYVITEKHAAAESLYLAIFAADSSRKTAWFALNQLGKMKFRLQDYPGAISTLQRRNALDPNSGEAYYFVGLSYKEMKRYPEAMAALRRGAELEPDIAERHFWLGILYAQLDSVPQAKVALERFVQLDSTSASASVAFRQIGYYHLLDGQYPRAVQALERSVQINEGDPQAWVWLAQGYQNSGDRNKALDGYERALQLDPRQPDALKGKQTLMEGGR
jgi:tetratricopeptide (TPR) repeat protein